GSDDEDEESISSDGTRSSIDETETSDEGSENEESMSETSDDDTGNQKIKPRNSVFKLWATQQLNQSMGYTPSYSIGEGQLLPAPPPLTKSTVKPPESTITVPSLEAIPNRRAHAVHVDRPEGIQQAR